MVYIVGVDIGSVFSKAVVMNRDKVVVSFHVLPSKGSYAFAGEEVMQKALTKAGLSLDEVACIIATGHGALKSSFTREQATEMSCHAKGVSHLFPSVRTIIDAGGQAIRTIRLNEQGGASSFAVSEKCAAGSGRFLQIIARVLDVDMDRIGELSLKSKNPVEFTSGCAVFAESEAISRVAEGESKENILAGAHRALAAKIFGLVQRVGLHREGVLIGGGAKDIGLVKSVEEKLGFKLVVPDEPQIITALGAALIAEERIDKGITNN